MGKNFKQRNMQLYQQEKTIEVQDDNDGFDLPEGFEDKLFVEMLFKMAKKSFQVVRKKTAKLAEQTKEAKEKHQGSFRVHLASIKTKMFNVDLDVLCIDSNVDGTIAPNTTITNDENKEQQLNVTTKKCLSTMRGSMVVFTASTSSIPLPIVNRSCKGTVRADFLSFSSGSKILVKPINVAVTVDCIPTKENSPTKPKTQHHHF